MKIKYVVVCTYEDDSREDFEEFDSYEGAESWIKETKYVSKFWSIEKRFIKE